MSGLHSFPSAYGLVYLSQAKHSPLVRIFSFSAHVIGPHDLPSSYVVSYSGHASQAPSTVIISELVHLGSLQLLPLSDTVV